MTDARAGLILILVSGILLMMLPDPAHAAWDSSASGSAAARAEAMPGGTAPTATVSNRNASVSWSSRSFASGSTVTGYVVKRYDSNGQAVAIGAACTGVIAALACTESAISGGSWRYSVTPAQGNWRGQESQLGSAVTVAAPSLVFTSSTTVSTLPSTLNGNVEGFVTGQTVSFRLDHPQTGALLSGSVSPNPIPTNGSAAITVTIPAGTSDGAYIVYALGSAGDIASASITVTPAPPPPAPRTFFTAAYDVQDSSSGTAATQSHPVAFADGANVVLAPWATTFSATRYIEVILNGPLPAGLTVSSATFNMTFSSAAANTTCVYFEVRRASTNEVLSSHGNATTPFACSSNTTPVTSATALTGVTTSAIANDLKIRLFGSNSASLGSAFDLATISGTTSESSFTLYPGTATDVNGAASTVYPWTLENDDGSIMTSLSAWDTAFSASKYLKLAFPAYVPAGATQISASFRHSYKSAASSTACYYLEIYSGATLVASRGSSTTPFSCNATASMVTDVVAITEIDTVAEANSAVIRVYTRNSGGSRKTQHDVARLTVNYSI